MVRPASFDKNGMKRGAWSEEEDHKLRACISRYGHSNWRLLPFVAGLKRCGKSCRLRWVNYLKPGLRRGNFTKDEKHLIIELHKQLGNRWSAIAAHFPGRTDNDIKNYWHAHIQKRRNRDDRIQNLAQEEESSDNNSSSVTTTTTGPTPAGIFGVFDSNADSSFNAGAVVDDQYDQLVLTNFNHHNLIEHENMIMSPIICDYLDLGVSHWNYSTDVKPEPDHFSTHTLPVGEDFFNFNIFGDNYYEYSQLYENMEN